MHKKFNEWQARDYAEKYGLSITGIRPGNITGPDKVHGSVDHVQCITLPGRGRPVEFPYRDMTRLVLHVDDAAAAFRAVLMAERPKHAMYFTGGHPVTLGELADIVRDLVPGAQIGFARDDGGRALSGGYRIDNSRILGEFGLRYTPLRETVAKVLAELRGA